jgi:hypothetical protein
VTPERAPAAGRMADPRHRPRGLGRASTRHAGPNWRWPAREGQASGQLHRRCPPGCC